MTAKITKIYIFAFYSAKYSFYTLVATSEPTAQIFIIHQEKL